MDRWPTCGQAWLGLLRHVVATGQTETDDRGTVLEAEGLLFEIEELSWDDPVVRAFGESGRFAQYQAKFVQRKVVPPFKYSYGARLRAHGGVDQIGWATQLLSRKPATKSGWISLTTPGEHGDCVPCLTGVALRLRARRLWMTAAFRSQNAFTAYLNYLPLRTIQAEVASDLGFPCGPMRVFVDVPHVYLADMAEIAPILAATKPPGHG